MAIKKALRGMTGGADLLRPKLSLGYVVAAIVAVAVLLGVWAGGKALYAFVGRKAQGLIPQAESVDYKAKLGI